jgi:hypothetical protein
MPIKKAMSKGGRKWKMEKEMEKEEKQRRDLSCKCTVIFSKNGRTLGSKFACWEGKKSNFRSRKGGAAGIEGFRTTSGVYILEDTPPPGEEKYQPMSFGGKYEKGNRKRWKM